jgi:polyisoprenoid-binding protein YceI
MTLSPQSATDLSLVTGTWTLDPAKTTIEFHTKAMWVLKVVGKAKATSGSATVDPDGSIAGTLVIDAASVDTGNKKRDTHLQSDDFFEVIKYPTMTYTATSGTLSPTGTLELQGNLTIHGQSRPINLTAEANTTGDTATVSAEFDIDRSEWGISWAKMGAGLQNRVVVTAHFVRS